MAKQPNQAAIERIKAAQNKSLQLMHLDSNGSMNKLVEGKYGEISNSLNSTDSNTTTQSLMSHKPSQYAATPSMRMTQAAKNLPKEIIESFQKNPIDASSLGYGEMDDLSMLTEGLEPKPSVTEKIYQPTVQPQAQAPSSTAQIDYPMIRTIVEDIVRKYAQSLNKRIVNESKNSNEQLNEVNSIVLGKTFKFLAKNGDIYEAKLTKIGNINKKNS